MLGVLKLTAKLTQILAVPKLTNSNPGCPEVTANLGCPEISPRN